MKKQVKGFICGFIVASILMAGTTSFADTIYQTIQVAVNAINIKVNGTLVNVPNFLLDGHTYVQIRSLSEILGKDVSWDPNSNTASINDKPGNTQASQTVTPDGSSKPQLTTQDIAQKGNSIVLIKIFDENGDLTATGSGFIVSPDGKVITNYHVIDGAGSIGVVTANNQSYKARVVNYNVDRDIAVIKLNNASNLPVVSLGDSGKVQLGEKVVAIGNPEGLQNVVSEGIISTMDRVVNGQHYIQITAPISPGSSGGALFNSYGEVIGITAGTLSEGESLNFAIPVNYVKQLLNS